MLMMRLWLISSIGMQMEITKAGIVEVIKALPKSIARKLTAAIKKRTLQRISGAKLKDIVKQIKARRRERLCGR
jgi:Glu-tRNA(Gln) amidotransferase subunit E-like FAD-binding protein